MIQSRFESGKLILSLEGEINSFNAPQIEGQIGKIRLEHPCNFIELDCDRLKYKTYRRSMDLHRTEETGGKTR